MKERDKKMLTDSNARLPCRGCTRRYKIMIDVMVNPGA